MTSHDGSEPESDLESPSRAERTFHGTDAVEPRAEPDHEANETPDSDRSSGGSRRRRAVAVLSVTWIAFGAVVWILFAVDPVAIAAIAFVPGLALAVLFGVGLIAARRWDVVWRRAFAPTIAVPGWIPLGVLLAAIGVVFASTTGQTDVDGYLWIGVFCTSGSYLTVRSTRIDRLLDAVSWPVWMALTVAIVLVFGAFGIALTAGTPLTVVFFLALLLFAFHVGFVLPVSLYQYGWVDDPPAEPTTYPSVSVLIPAYNEAGFVGECIEAVLASEYPDEHMEVIVIDDGSTDGTAAEAAAYRDRGVKLFRRDNGGKHAALNFGLQCASGSVIVTVDADSRPEPDAISRMVAQLEADPSIGGLSAAVIVGNDDGFLTRLQRAEYAVCNTNRRAYSVFDAVPVVPGCLGVYRREALDDVWGYDPDTVTEDFDLTVKLLKRGWAVRHGVGVVRTIAPSSWKTLWRQRLRWYRGGIETLIKHRDALLRPEYRYLHALSLPARLVSHLFTPVASVVILTAVVWGLVVTPSTYLLVLCLLFFALTWFIALFSVVVEDEPVRTLAYAPLLFVGYKHFVDCAIGVGTIRAFVANQRW